MSLLFTFYGFDTLLWSFQYCLWVKIIMQLCRNCLIQFFRFHVINTVLNVSLTFLKILVSNPSVACKWFFAAMFVVTFLYFPHELQTTKIFTPKKSKICILWKNFQIYPKKNTCDRVLSICIFSCFFFLIKIPICNCQVILWYRRISSDITAQKISIKDLFIKSIQIRSFLWILSHLLKKSIIKNSIFLCSVC